MSWINDGDKTLAIQDDEQILEVTVPIRFVRARGRRRLYGEATIYNEPVDNSLKEALVKAHRWERKLMRGEATSIQALAQREGVDKSDMSKILRLTTLAPEIQADVMAGGGKWPLSFAQLKGGFPLEWGEQRKNFNRLMSL